MAVCRRISVATLLTMFALGPAAAGTPPPPEPPPASAPRPVSTAPRLASDAPISWKQFGHDGAYVFGRPAHLDRAGWRRFGVLVGTGLALYLFRDQARNFVLDNTSDSTRTVVEDARNMGKLGTPLAVALGYYLTGLARHSRYDQETSVVILENLAYAGAITGTEQYVVATERPIYGDSINFFSNGGHSASGDVTIAASILAPVIDRHLLVQPDDGPVKRFWKRFGSAALYAGAGLTAWQRMAADRHWLPDVYFGYINGLMVGKMIVDSRRGGREWRVERRHPVEVSFSGSGLSISWPYLSRTPPTVSPGLQAWLEPPADAERHARLAPLHANAGD